MTGRHGARRDGVPPALERAAPAPPPAAPPPAAPQQRGPLVVPRRRVVLVCVVALVLLGLSQNWLALVPVLVVLLGVYSGRF